jgi:uncharacterized membrane protein YoaK (UPF0700 family)
MGETLRRVWPWTGSGHGPLPLLLVLLTVVTGLVDAVSYLALGAFLAGAAAGGRIGAMLSDHRGLHLRTATAIALPAVIAAALLAAIVGLPFGEGTRYALIVLLALAMGAQNATARRLAVPDLTTTVLTQTLTGVAADSRLAGGSGGRPGRRGVAVAAMGLGAFAGALLLLHVDAGASLALAVVLMCGVAVAAHVLSAGEPTWGRHGG